MMNWNDKWYPYMKRIAIKMIGGYRFRSVDCDELVNFAWIDTVRRLPAETPIAIVGKAARGSMYRYLFGRAGRKHVPIQSTTVYDERGESELLSMTARETFTYDDIEEMVAMMDGLTSRQQEVLLMLLQGWNQVEIAEKLCVTPMAVCVRVRRMRYRAHTFGRKQAC